MRWKRETKELAKELRSNGLTYFEIRKKIGKDVPKSTLSSWCRDVKMPKFYKEKIRKLNFENQSRALKIAILANRKKRQRFLEGLRLMNLHLLKDINAGVLKLLLAIFYLAEGGKYPSTKYVKFASSDSEIIRFFLRSFKKTFKTDPSKFRVQLLCRADQDLDRLKSYWVKVTHIDDSLFYRARIDKRTIGKRTRKKDYKGVCVINYFDTSIQLELQLLGRSIVKKV